MDHVESLLVDVHEGDEAACQSLRQANVLYNPSEKVALPAPTTAIFTEVPMFLASARLL